MASMVRGGGETFDVEIARHLAELGCDISFLTGIPLFSGPRLPYSGFRFQVSGFSIRTPYFGWFPWDRTPGGWRVRLADFWMFEKAAASWAARRAADFDVVQVCELPTFVMEWKRRGMRAPVVMRLTAPDFHDETGAIRVADGVIAAGHTMTKVREDIRPDCENISNGVDTEFFKPQASDFRARHGIGAEELVVLFVARFQGVKNHRMLIDAMGRVAQAQPSVRLVLAGSGPLENDVRARCRERGILDRVHFLGEVPYADLPRIYAAADVKVISSDYESFCFAALEAMATELPLVVTDTDWVPRLIERGKGGIVVPKGDAAAMAEAILALAADPGRRRALGAWNRQHVAATYGWPASARKLLALYERLALAPGLTHRSLTTDH
jgi:glycosyltransferase involved in cell wall biosynthesis